ncbi:MAG: hypothetical protein HYS27_17055 [Deltaproteobacteria bacterium]|nr:hypothetical protein [Deltaproteobacteria bacterium]
MEPIATRPQETKEALDQALAEAVSLVRNDPASAKGPFDAMRDSLLSARDPAVCVPLVKKLVATALSSWTPPTADPPAFAAAAAAAGFDVVVYAAGKHPGPAVVREPSYPSARGPLLRSVCRAFADDVLTPVYRHLQEIAAKEPFVVHFAELVRAGSLEAPAKPAAAPSPRFRVASTEQGA